MKRSKYYGLRLPERGAREGEANDPADVEDLTYDFGVVDAELERQRSEDARLEKDKAARAEMLRHTGDWENPHGVTAAQAGAYTKAEADALVDGAVAAHAERSDNPHAVTKAQVGLGKVPNVATDDQTPAYTEAAGPSALSSGEKLSAAFAKLAAAVTALLAHLADSVRHLTEAERGAWDGAAEAAHTHANKSLLDAYAQTEADLAAVVGAKHGHTNQSVLDEITAAQVRDWDAVTQKLPLAGGTLTGPLTLHADPAKDGHAATKRYVDHTLAAAGSGDMKKSVYDTDGSGVVDDAERLGGQAAAYYAAASAVTALVSGTTPAGAVDGGTY